LEGLNPKYEVFILPNSARGDFFISTCDEILDIMQGFMALWLQGYFRLRKILSHCASKRKFLGIHAESFSWNCARTGVSVVVDRGEGVYNNKL